MGCCSTLLFEELVFQVFQFVYKVCCLPYYSGDTGSAVILGFIADPSNLSIFFTDKDLTVLLIFSKNYILVSLISSIVTLFAI